MLNIGIKLRDIARALIPAKPGPSSSKLTPEEEAKLTWVKLVHTVDDLPEIYHEPLLALINIKHNFPYMVLTPSYKEFITRWREKLICCFDHEIDVLEESRGKIVTTVYPINGISYIEMGSALLQSWMKICGITDQEDPGSTLFKFNTASEKIIAPIVEKIRPKAESPKEDRQGEDATLARLEMLNYKLMNYAKRCISPGEPITAIILQPEVRHSLFGLPISKTLTLPHLTMLTGRELIHIQDGVKRWWQGGFNYGGVWKYIPLSRINSFILDGSKTELLVVTLLLYGDESIDLAFSKSNGQAVEEFTNKLDNALKAKMATFDMTQ